MRYMACEGTDVNDYYYCVDKSFMDSHPFYFFSALLLPGIGLFLRFTHHINFFLPGLVIPARR